MKELIEISYILSITTNIIATFAGIIGGIICEDFFEMMCGLLCLMVAILTNEIFQLKKEGDSN